VNKLREDAEGEDGPSGSEWTISDYLVAMAARVKRLKLIGVDLLDAACHTVRHLWPGADPPARIEDLKNCLQASDERLDEWRQSSARAGADVAMQFVLSWHESMEPEKLQTIRQSGKFVTLPDWVKRRQEAAYRFAEYADVENFHEDPNAEDEEDEPEEEAGAAAP